MNAVIFYSNTGQSEAVAKYIAKKLSYPIMDIEKVNDKRFENLVLVFPVHCQNVPHIVKRFLSAVNVKNLTAIATYGKMCCGNVLYELQNRFHMNIVAGAYIPTKHTYLDESGFCDFECLTPLLEKIKNASPKKIPKLYKNPFANFFPRWRSRMGVKLYKNANCNDCGVCTEKCSFKAIKNGVVTSKCIRCLKCVQECPNRALEFKLRLPLKLYLRKKKINKTIIYI